jgi:parvulin-like peptidyl-prolyl isomerase
VNEVAQTQKIAPESLPMVQAAILQKLVERDLVQQYLTQQKMQPSEPEINAALEKLKTELQLKNLSLDDFLKRTHQTEATVRKSLGNDVSWNKFVAQQTNDKTLQQFFDRFHEQFDGTERRVSHILLRPDGKADQEAMKALVVQANQLHDQITSGVISFEDAAEKYSAGPSRTRGGDLGFIPIKGVMLEPFSQAAFSIKQGDVSEPVITGFGVHLIKVTDIRPGKKTWQEVRDQLQPALANFLRASLTKQLLDKSTVQYAAGVPHFKKGTTQLEVSESTPSS